MEFRDVLARRRMHRAFLPDPLPREQIERIVGVIRRAPSGGFSQGGSIVVVTDAVMRRRIGEAFEDDSSPHPYISTAPLHLVISANEALYHARYNEPDKLAATGGVEVTSVSRWSVARRPTRRPSAAPPGCASGVGRRATSCTGSAGREPQVAGRGIGA